jgi:hypothetical protein
MDEAIPHRHSTSSFCSPADMKQLEGFVRCQPTWPMPPTVPIIARISIRPEESEEKIGIHNGFDIHYLFFSKKNFSTMLMLLSSTHLPHRFSISSFFKVLFSSQFSLCKKFHNIPLGHVYFFS